MAETNKVEVVISGIAGIFPESDNVDELKNLLFNKQNGITLDSRRWPLDEYGVTSGVGKVKCINRFDNVFFNMHHKLSECSETVIKLNLERSVEAIIDAGINPGDLYDTNTAVFTCSSGSETDTIAMFDEAKSGFAILGHNKAMQANRLSYVLNLNGPSFTIFSSFTGGVDALVMAKHMIEKGHIRTAIIGGCNLVQRPNLSLQLKGLGVLTDGLETRSFSDNADGFNRSESCVAILLQNSLDAKRSYGTIMSVKMEQYGELRGVFTNYSSEQYKKIVMEAYKDAGVDPANVAYVEADGCAIKNVDAMELDVIKEVFCPPGRKEPLKIGSIKSNIGHTDASAGLVAIIKAIIVMDTGYIPPNIHYAAPNSESDGLTSGKIQVVSETTPFNGDIIGVNIFGRTGNYGHIILKKHDKPKKKIYEKDEMFDDGLPRLILVSGRSDDGVRQTIRLIENYNVDEEYASLLHKVYSKNISAHFSRSFFIIPTPGPRREKDVYPITNEKPPIWFVFSGMGSQWLGMGTQLLRVPIFARAIEKCDAVLKPKGINIVHILTSLDSHLFDNILNSFVGISAIQIGLVDILKALEIKPDGIIGHSVGELGCAYADGCFTAEEMIMAAYARGRASVETELPDGMMAAIGLGYKSIKDRLPPDVDVACHNSSESCTISGLTGSVMDFVKILKSEKVFAKAVNVSNISFHSRYIQPAAPTLLKYLKEILPNPKQRSSRWLSTSIQESNWNSDLARYNSAEYHTNNLLSPVFFEETCRHIPKNAVVIEIAPHGLLQAILKKSLSNVVNIPLTQKVYGDSVKYLLTAIGKMYCNGLNPNIEMLYPPVDFPVSAGTPPLHTLCKWNHEEEWSIIDVAVLIKKTRGERLISLSPTTNSSIEEYEILGHHVLPLSALLFYTWESFVHLHNETSVNIPVVFEDVHYYKHVVINKIQPSDLCTSIQAGTGRFELCLNNKIVLSGNIFVLDGPRRTNSASAERTDNDGGNPIVSLDRDEIYASLEQFGYCVGDVFKTLRHINIFEDELQSDVTWDRNWIHYLDAMLQLPTVYHTEKCGDLVVPVMIHELYIDPAATALDTAPKDLAARYNVFTNEVTCAGLRMSLSRFEQLPLDPSVKITFQLDEQALVNLINPNFDSPIDFVDMCVKVALEYKHGDDHETVFACPIYDAQDYVMRNYTERILQTRSSDIELMEISVGSAKHLNTGSDSLQYIVLTRNDELSRATSLMANKSRVHYIVRSSGPISDSTDYTVVLQQKFGDDYLSLMKKTSKIDNDVIIHRLTTENINCPDQFQNVLNNLTSLNKTIYIVSKIQPADGILSLVRKTNVVKNIRFFFVFDYSAPSFSTNNPFYSKQLAKGLLVNVYQNGEWVTYKEMEFISAVNTQTSMKKTILANLSNTSIKNVSVKCIGLNSQDTIMETKKNNNNAEYELGPIEYSGLTSGGSTIMGVAPLSPTITNITPDPILSWTIPKDMSFEEASTIPVPYSMAYYILNEISKITEKHSVLVHAGLTAVGKAAIDVCLEKKCRVFVTVSDFEQIEQLKRRFPTLPRSNVTVCNKENYEIKFLMAHKKMDVIINCLDGEDFHASLRLIAVSGKIFQLTKTDMKKKYKMGMLTFLQNVSLFSVGMDRILAENEAMKRNIQSSIERGLRDGTIKPFERYVLTSACTGTQALDTLKKLARENDFRRVVICTSNANVAGNAVYQFQCRPDKVYFVIGNGTDDWLCLVEWLAQRGAIKVVVALEKYSLTPVISRKFNMFMDRYKGITVQLVSQSSLNTEESACGLLDSSVTTYPLAAMFFVSAIDERIIENMQYAMNKVTATYEQKPLFACLLCGGAKPCESLRSTGVNAFCLSWAQNTGKPKLSKIVPILDSLISRSETLTNAVVVCSELNIDQLLNGSESQQFDYYNTLFPSTVDELRHSVRYVAVGEPDFVEVATKSVLYADAKGAYPIFVVPGFRPTGVQKLYRNLGYPTFEARYPSRFESIKSVAEVLVRKLRRITEHHAVTLIGESWGGAVALVMTQILESQGVLVSLTLLNGVPSTLRQWIADNFVVNDNLNVALLSRYLSIDNKVAEKFTSQREWNANLTELLSSNGIPSAGEVCQALRAIQMQLNTLLALEPLPNKLLSVPQVFIFNELYENSTDILSEFCVNQPVVHIVAETCNRDNMMEDAKMIKTINENVAFDYPHSSTKSLDDKYSQHYYSVEIPLVC